MWANGKQSSGIVWPGTIVRSIGFRILATERTNCHTLVLEYWIPEHKKKICFCALEINSVLNLDNKSKKNGERKERLAHNYYWIMSQFIIEINFSNPNLIVSFVRANHLAGQFQFSGNTNNSFSFIWTSPIWSTLIHHQLSCSVWLISINFVLVNMVIIPLVVILLLGHSIQNTFLVQH